MLEPVAKFHIHILWNHSLFLSAVLTGGTVHAAHTVLPFILGEKEKGDEQCNAPCVIWKME